MGVINELVRSHQSLARSWDQKKGLSERLGLVDDVDREMFCMFLSSDLARLWLRKSVSLAPHWALYLLGSEKTPPVLQDIASRFAPGFNRYGQRIVEDVRFDAEIFRRSYYPKEDQAAHAFAASLDCAAGDLGHCCTNFDYRGEIQVRGTKPVVARWAQKWRPMIEQYYDGSEGGRDTNILVAEIMAGLSQ